MEDISSLGEIDVERVEFSDRENLFSFINRLCHSPAEYRSALEILLESLRRCTGMVTKVDFGKYEYAGKAA
jgi:magnesium chelatase subunit I